MGSFAVEDRIIRIHPALDQDCVPDYFVASIAIAQAERFLESPQAAPPTPTLGENIRFLQAHRAELQAMRERDRAK